MKLAKTTKPCCPDFAFVETGLTKTNVAHVRLLTMNEELGDFDHLNTESLILRCARCGKEAEPAYSGAFVLDSDGNVEFLDAADAQALADQFEEAKALGSGPFVFIKPKRH